MALRGDNSISANYFLANSTKSFKCDDTLQDYNLEELSGFNGTHQDHAKEKANLIVAYKNQFLPKIFTLLTNGFNVILDGIGSKRALIEDFVSSYLNGRRSVVICGYMTDINQRHILYALREAMECNKMDEESIITKSTGLKEPLYLIIHSIDRLCAGKDNKIKNLINKILIRSYENVHLLASVDHVNSSLLWSSKEVDKLNLVWLSCPTFQNYKIEKGFTQLTTAIGSGYSKYRSQQLTLIAISSVFDNLPPNAQRIFLLILNYYQSNLNDFAAVNKKKDQRSKRKDQESESDDDDDADENDSNKKKNQIEGYPFNQLYQDCMEAFYVNSEATLKAQLVEFKDHKLIRSKSGSDGTEFIELMVPTKLIPKLIQELSG